MTKPKSKTLYRVTASPYPADEDLPWEYEEEAFIRWVDEVFDEGYKKPEDAPFPSVDKCLSLLEAAGYTVEVK